MSLNKTQSGLKQFLSGKNTPSSISKNQPDPIKVRIDLVRLLVDPRVTSITLINYLQLHHIDPNTYLPSLNDTLHLPILYYCCSNPNLQDFFLFLLDNQVNVKACMISEDNDSSRIIELLYYSQIVYIPTLIERGAQLNPEMIPINGEKLLLKGNITKLITLYKYGAIPKDTLITITQKPNLIFRVLDHLYERIFLLCQQVKNPIQFQENSDIILKNYLTAFKLFFKNGISVNQMEDGETFLQKVLNTYFEDLIRLTVNYQPSFDHVDFLHYSNFDLTNRQVMKYFYNDDNYQKIKEFLKDKIVPEKINVKTVLLKKKVQTKTATE